LLIEKQDTAGAVGMSKKVVLVGHCGPDSSYLRMVVKQAAKDATLLSADNQIELNEAIEKGADLLLFNRELGYGFDENLGAEVIRKLRPEYPSIRMMLVSNYPDAQAAAVAAGALPGFGKREIGSPRVVQLLQDALK
jgi:two-component system chemotaxis response regulator CheY